jgi:hypothetical protein
MDLSKKILNKMLSELNVHAPGEDIERAILGPKGGISYFRFLLSDPELSDDIIGMRKEISDFNKRLMKINHDYII